MSSLLTTLLLPSSVEKYSPDQERDERGRWSSGGGAAGAASRKAYAASDKARGSRGEEKNRLHVAAAKAHEIAATVHAKAAHSADVRGNSALRTDHIKAMNAHINASVRHWMKS